MRWFLRLSVVIATGCILAYLLLIWPLSDKHPRVRPANGLIAIRDATIYVSPKTEPLRHATLLARNGRIQAVGTAVPIPPGTQVLPCRDCAVTAGFWNMHVHFTEPKWSWSAWKSASKLNAQLADMLTSRGFTAVVDLGSDIRETVSLRRRIETGNLIGPKIYTAGSALYPENGIPFYIREHNPAWLIRLLSQPATATEAAHDEQTNIERGADVLKLFTGSYVSRGRVKPMRVEVAAAAVQVAHAQGQIAFAHPSNLAGVRVALSSGVDVLAHAPDDTDGLGQAEIRSIAAHSAMIPTLKMFATTVTTKPSYLEPIYNVVRQFHQSSGTLLFGTDVGYMSDYTTTGEFHALSQCGLSAMDILQMLTVAPAKMLKEQGEKGTLEPGKLADYVVLESDPAVSIDAFSHVAATVRSGRILWQRAGY